MTTLSVVLGYTGSRRGMTAAQLDVVVKCLANDVKAVHSGDCIGGDEQFHRLAVARGIWTEGHPPTNPSRRAFCTYDVERAQLPYLDRNRAIVDAATHVIATPDSYVERDRSGTWATIRYAKSSRKPIKIIFPDGSVETNGWETS
jgi:hypothetical protein